MIHGVAAEGDHRVAAHGRVALVVQEQHRHVGVGMVGRHEQGAVHLGMAARLAHQQAAVAVEPRLRVPPPLQERGTFRGRIAVGDDPHGLACGVHLDGADRDQLGHASSRVA